MSPRFRLLAVMGVALCLAVNVAIAVRLGWTPLAAACTVFTGSMLLWTLLSADRR